MADIDYTKDPTPGIWGIKFDTGFPTGNTTVWFTLDADYPSVEVPVGIKPGTLILTGTIEGPLVSSGIYDVVLEAVDVPAPNAPPWLGWRMKATATAGVTDPPIVKVVFNWYGPFTPGVETPSADPARLQLTTENSSVPFESWYRAVDLSTNPYGLLHEDDIGGWYVEAEFYVENPAENYYIKGLASDSLDISGVPEFSSLALVLVATVGTVVFFKRRGTLSIPV